MNILALDTSASACSLALLSEDRVWSSHEMLPLQQAAHVLPRTESLLKSAGLSLSRLDAIAFGRGPGSFTGLRIAAAMTQGLAFALGIPVIPVSSLAVLALGAARQHGWEYVVAAVDARMHEIWWGAFQVEGGDRIRPVLPEGICTPGEFPLPQAACWRGAGSAFGQYAGELPWCPSQTDPGCHPHADIMLLPARQAFLSGETVLPHEALPVYLREQVAHTG